MQYRYNHNLANSFSPRRPSVAAAAAAAAVLGQKHQSIDLLKIIRLLNNPDSVVRVEAIKNLTAINGSTAQDAVIRCVNDNDYNVRIAACRALGHMRAHRAKAHLYDALVDRNALVRCAAAESLAVMGDRQGLAAVTKLIRMAGNHQMAALRALNHITGHNFPINKIGLKEAQKWVKHSKFR